MSTVHHKTGSTDAPFGVDAMHQGAQAMSQDYKVGDRVRAKAAIYEPADDHAPGGYVCGAGDLLIVRAVRTSGQWPLSVSHEDVTDNSFACSPDEVTPIEEPKP